MALDWFKDRLKDKSPKNEPVAYVMLAKWAATLLAGYGLELTEEQLVTLFVVVELIATWVQRKYVYPKAKVEETLSPATVAKLDNA